jgi:UDPglucose 6-dehydrogenase
MRETLKGGFIKIGIIDTGYVCLVTATCFAHMGNDVICMDTDKDKIYNLNRVGT